MFRVPDAVVTRRPISLNGAVVPAGTTLSKAQVLALGKGLDALLDGGFVVASPDPFARKGKARPQPTSLPPVIRNALVKKLNGPVQPLAVSLTAAGLAISVSITGGTSPFDLVLLDRNGEVLDGKSTSTRTSMFTPVDGGEYTVTVTDSSGGSASSTIIIQSSEPEPKKPKKKADVEAGE